MLQTCYYIENVEVAIYLFQVNLFIRFFWGIVLLYILFSAAGSDLENAKKKIMTSSVGEGVRLNKSKNIIS